MQLCGVCVFLVGVICIYVLYVCPWLVLYVFVWCMSVPGWCCMCLCGPAREGMFAWRRSEADVGISSSVISFTFVRQVFITEPGTHTFC